jgi:hypothetical protein
VEGPKSSFGHEVDREYFAQDAIPFMIVCEDDVRPAQATIVTTLYPLENLSSGAKICDIFGFSFSDTVKKHLLSMVYQPR